MTQKRPELIFLVFILAIFFSMAVISLVWKNNGVYTKAYQPKIEKAIEYERETAKEEKSNSFEPRPLGFQEEDIDKQQGRRYKTF